MGLESRGSILFPYRIRVVGNKHGPRSEIRLRTPTKECVVLSVCPFRRASVSIFTDANVRSFSSRLGTGRKPLYVDHFAGLCAGFEAVGLEQALPNVRNLGSATLGQGFRHAVLLLRCKGFHPCCRPILVSLYHPPSCALRDTLKFFSDRSQNSLALPFGLHHLHRSP